MTTLLLLLALGCHAPAAAAPPAMVRPLQESSLPGGLEPSRLQSLLQRFVDQLYMKAFRHLGDERDFDHGHILFSSVSKRPFAILYHTQEMARDQPAGGEFGYVNPEARNWLQWIDRDGIVNADSYQRKDFPRTAFWRWFEEERLPTLRQYHTIIDKMLDPAKLGEETSESLQWVFTRFDCAKPLPALSKQSPINIHLPTGETVCLVLSTS